MSGEDRLSQLAQEHKKRQAQRAAEEKAARGKRNAVIGAVVALVVVAAGVTAAVTLTGGDAKEPAARAAVTPTPDPTQAPNALASDPPARKGPVTCNYTKDTTDVPKKFVGMPPRKANPKYTKMTVVTNRGDIEIELDPQTTPCTINSMAFLAKKNFYDNTRCHRLVKPEHAGVYLLQCGDPQAKGDGKNPTDGTGTAGYFIPDEAIGTVAYTKGVVFMTQPGQEATNMSSSQFAVSLDDINATLPEGYIPLGMVTKGLEWIYQVADQGVIENPNDVTGTEGGSTAPRLPIVIKDVRLSTK
ncbi:peptidylprolyl isomerase [Thermoactinospora rubra]|uniref:peptidylprolyl isomerase n=1 Tax=Thermoactinospora rubra TaxID=1088767 RepID=UPI000A0FD36C|nr:peptidylprolyl isomerase [Thermoactinospora rubra]